MSETKKPAKKKAAKKPADKLSQIFDWPTLMSVKGDGKRLYYTRSMPNKSGMMGLASLDMSVKTIKHFHDVKPLEYFAKSHAGVLFDKIDEIMKKKGNKLSLEGAAVTAIEEVNKLIWSEYEKAKKEAQKEDKPLPVKPKEIQQYDSRRFVNWYVFINHVLSDLMNKSEDTKS